MKGEPIRSQSKTSIHQPAAHSTLVWYGKDVLGFYFFDGFDDWFSICFSFQCLCTLYRTCQFLVLLYEQGAALVTYFHLEHSHGGVKPLFHFLSGLLLHIQRSFLQLNLPDFLPLAHQVNFHLHNRQNCYPFVPTFQRAKVFQYKRLCFIVDFINTFDFFNPLLSVITVITQFV